MVATFLLLIFPLIAKANCNLTNFRWEYDVPAKLKPVRAGASLVYCGNIPLYVSQTQLIQVLRYQRASVNMVLKVNGEYIDSPCVPAHR